MEDANAKSAKPQGVGPKDRYIAPEMATWAPVFTIGHSLLVPTRLNKKAGRLFVIDTSSQFTAVSRNDASEVAHLYSGRIVRSLTSKARNAGNVTLQFGDKIQAMYDVTVLDLSDISKNLGTEVSGFIGSSALQLLTIRIDYRDGLVKFDYDPKRGTNRPF